MKALLRITTLGVLLLFWGCKPGETTVSGDVFIATSGGTSFKLGAVEVLLLEKKPLLEALQSRRAEIDLQIESKKQRILAMQGKADAAKDATQKAEAEYQSSLKSKPWQAGSNYQGALADFNKFSEAMALWERQKDSLRAEGISSTRSRIKPRNQPSIQSGGVPRSQFTQNDRNAAEFAISIQNNPELRSRWEAAKNTHATYNKKASESERVMAEIENSALTLLRANRDKRQKEWSETENELVSLKQELANYPSSGDFLADLHIVAAGKAVTDADGRFSFTFPSDKDVALFAKARRSIPFGEAEEYFWLVNVPRGGPGARVSLNNANLINADPDGYLKLPSGRKNTD